MIKSVSDAFTQLERTLADDIGFCLFTVLLVDLPDVVRVHSSNPKYYSLYEYYFDLFITSSAYQLISAIIPSRVLSSAPRS